MLRFFVVIISQRWNDNIYIVLKFVSFRCILYIFMWCYISHIYSLYDCIVEVVVGLYQWNLLYPQLSSEHSLHSWLLSKTWLSPENTTSPKKTFKWQLFFSLTQHVPLGLKMGCMSFLLIFVASRPPFPFFSLKTSAP